MGETQISGEGLVWALGALAQLNRIPFDPKLILQQFAPPYYLETLHEVGDQLGFQDWPEPRQGGSPRAAQLPVPRCSQASARH